jgi:flotillin
MTRENLQFLLRVAFNVGPRTSPENDEVSPHLKKYVMLLPNAKNTNGSHVQKIVKDVIEGRARVLVSSMTMEQIRADLNSFMKVLSNNIQAELDQYGLKIHNAEAKELG